MFKLSLTFLCQLEMKTSHTEKKLPESALQRNTLENFANFSRKRLFLSFYWKNGRWSYLDVYQKVLHSNLKNSHENFCVRVFFHEVASPQPPTLLKRHYITSSFLHIFCNYFQKYKNTTMVDWPEVEFYFHEDNHNVKQMT